MFFAKEPHASLPHTSIIAGLLGLRKNQIIGEQYENKHETHIQL